MFPVEVRFSRRQNVFSSKHNSSVVVPSSTPYCRQDMHLDQVYGGKRETHGNDTAVRLLFVVLAPIPGTLPPDVKVCRKYADVLDFMGQFLVVEQTTSSSVERTKRNATSRHGVGYSGSTAETQQYKPLLLGSLILNVLELRSTFARRF